MKRPTIWLLVMACASWGVSSLADDTTPLRYTTRMQQATHSLPAEVEVFVHSHLLGPDDRLQDGPYGNEIRLDGETLLIWVDKGPRLRFVHPTAYVLVSAAGVRVVDGEWWPVLNGRRILYGKQNHATIVSPYELPTSDGAGILVHVYPEELAPGDLLADGDAVIGPMRSTTFFAWVDMLPTAFFTHPTVYLLVTADKQIIVRDGGWWPVLNGKTVLYGSAGRHGVAFPFRLR